MAKRERFGKFVLLDEVSTSGLGTEYRAAKLAGAALERLVSLIRVTPALSGNPDFAKALMEQAKAAARLQSPNVLRLVAIGGPIGGSLYLAYEHIESKSLKAILERSRRDGFPFAADQALLIASKLCAALEYAHGKKGESGRQIHGFVNPDAVLVTHDGDIKVRGFGTWGAGIRQASGIAGDEALYLSPEQLAGGAADAKSDLFAVGALLFEMLTSQPLFSYSSGRDVTARLSGARLASAPDADALPKAMLEILTRALAAAPSERFSDMGEMHRVLDALMFSGEFNPTTFNLAFFMHSLFREEIEREAQAVAEEKAASYAEFADEAAKPAPAARAAAPPAPAQPATPPPAPQVAAPPAVAPPATVRGPELELRLPHKEETHPPRAKEHATPAEGVAAHPVSAREAAAGLTFHKEEPKRGAPVMAGIGIVVAIVAIAGWYFGIGPGAGKSAPSPPPATLTAEAAAAVARVKELEEKLKRFEQEKADAEAKAAEDAKKKVEAQAAAKGQSVDPAVLLKAQEDARKRAQAEQEKRQLEERRRVEEEKKAEEARVQEEKRRAEAAAAAAAAAAATTTPAPTLPPVTQAAATPPPATPAPATTPAEPSTKPGALVNLNDLGVIAPIVASQAPLQYPAFALQQRAEGTVELNVLIDERGNVLEAKVVKGAAGLGLNQAAVDNVKRRKYRPATKDGVPVRVYMPVLVRFELPR